MGQSDQGFGCDGRAMTRKAARLHASSSGEPKFFIVEFTARFLARKSLLEHPLDAKNLSKPAPVNLRHRKPLGH
jgi:hypothetical protein